MEQKALAKLTLNETIELLKVVWPKIPAPEDNTAEDNFFKDGSQQVPGTEDELLEWVCKEMAFTAHMTAKHYLLMLHISPESLAKDPAGVFVELRGKI